MPRTKTKRRRKSSSDEFRRSALHNAILRDASIRFRDIEPEICGPFYYVKDPDPVGKMQRTCRTLERRGWLTKHRAIPLWPLPEVSKPLYVGDPKNPAPFDAEEIAWQAQRRWKESAVEEKCVWRTSKKARRLFGGAKPKPVRFDQMSHDLHCTKIAMFYKRNSPKLFHWLRHESVYSNLYQARRDKLPDFLVVTESLDYLHPLFVIDSFGSYTAKQCQSFFDRHMRGGGSAHIHCW